MERLNVSLAQERSARARAESSRDGDLAELAATQSERPKKAKTARMKFLQMKMLRKYDVHVAPVFGGGSALAGPVGRVIEVVGNLGGPEAGGVAIVDIAFHGLA